MKKMVKIEEIEHLSNLIKIEIKDYEKYGKQIEQVINYFKLLDNIEIDSGDTIRQELALDDLREDQYIPYEDKLVEKLKRTRENFVRAPKMV